jgi:hypothetical protein
MQYEPIQVLEAHKLSVSVADAMYYEESNNVLSTFLASASIDSTINIWSRHSENFDLSDSKFTLDQTITCKANGFALTLKFYLLPLSNCKNLKFILFFLIKNQINFHIFFQ